MLFAFPLFSQVQILKPDGTNASIKDIEFSFQETSVLILGEEHNDKVGHEWKFELIQTLSRNVDFAISMEMLERDQQIIINEYMNGLYDENMFQENMRLWNNWKDYKPIFEFAKEKKIKVYAANPPRRYVRAVSRKGIEIWNEFSGLSYLYLPNLELVKKYRDPVYETKFLEAMGRTHSQNLENFLFAQHIWDESMAEIIAREVRKSQKMIHINGRFHSDYFMGVTYRLKAREIGVTTISIFPESQLANTKDWSKLANFIVITK